MKNTAPTLAKSVGCLGAVDLPRQRDSWLLVGEINRHSQRTLDARRDLLDKLIWFWSQRQIDECDTAALRLFLHYATNGHKEPGGRWGNPRMTRPVKPGTIKDHHAILRTFFGWLVSEDVLDNSPMTKVQRPVDRPDQIQPFTDDHLKALLDSARKSNNPRRDEAILLLMLDTGVRASELCGLTYGNIDLQTGICRVEP